MTSLPGAFVFGHLVSPRDIFAPKSLEVPSPDFTTIFSYFSNVVNIVGNTSKIVGNSRKMSDNEKNMSVFVGRTPDFVGNYQKNNKS